jgi:DNA-binding Xre family transcriptional regulator
VDSIAASAQGLELVNQKRLQKGWNRTAQIWCREAFTTRSTLNRFWAGKPIRRETFIAICAAVEVDWQMVEAQPIETPPIAVQPIEASSVEAQHCCAPIDRNEIFFCPYLALLVVTYRKLQEIQQILENDGTGGNG